jgi:P-type conjugative transfer ATPase TrbB
MRNIHTNNTTVKRHLDMLSTAFGNDIATFLQDPNVIEIMLNPDGKLWIDTYDNDKYFTGICLNEPQALNIIKLIAAYHDEVADYDHPEVACELPETNSRFQGWLPPVVTSPTFAIRKRAVHIFTFENYIDNGTLTKEQAEKLRIAVNARKNILVSGGTSSGKTTFVNAILHELKNCRDRVVILEDLPELQIEIADCVKFMTTSNISMRTLVKGVLRMRPDRIIIGEVRDGTALDLLKAWNTGHPGGICTIHANSPDATISRLEDLVREATTIVPDNLIKEAINIIVFMKRNNEGKHKIESITELQA